MLRETDLSVMEICAAVGYSNSSYFYRIFESATGMSPAPGGLIQVATKGDKRPFPPRRFLYNKG